jgi:penicillin-binding protein 2
MRNNSDNYEAKQTFNRRSFLIAGTQALLMTTLIGRLSYLGIKRSSHYQTLADENRIKLHILLPPRGLIYDRQGQILASNQPNYRLVLVPDFKGDLYGALRMAESLVGLEGYSIEELAEEIKKSRRVAPFTLREGLSWDEVCKIEVHTPHLSGLAIEKGAQRFYPLRELTGHLIGYVQIPNEDDEVEKNLLHLPDFRLGKAGLEKEFDDILRGQAGYKEIEVNAVRKVVRELSVRHGKEGATLSLTLDMRLQTFVAKRVQEHESAAVVVMDVHSGEVYTMVSSPSFDPNLFTNGIRTREWKGLMANPYGIMNNKALTGLYAPGSTFKMMVALAALESNKLSPEHKIYCSGYTELNGHRYYCMHSHGHMNMVAAIKKSCDVYFYEVAKIIGHERIAEMALRFGLGQKTGIELPGEKKGIVPTRAWKFLKQRRKWTMGDTILMSIGQGYMLATPLQLAVMMARLVNGGKAVRPTLLLQNVNQHSESLNISPHSLEIIRQGMEQVVNDPGGTAAASRIMTRGKEMGGKTGTSQVRRISKKERQTRVLRNDELPWQDRDHSLFVGYAPLHAPKYAVAVIVEHGGAGARIAARIAHDTLEFAQNLENI